MLRLSTSTIKVQIVQSLFQVEANKMQVWPEEQLQHTQALVRMCL